MSHERLDQMIQAHQSAMLAHPEAQATHEAIISLLQGLDAGEITPAQCVRLLRYQAALVATANLRRPLPPGSGRSSADAARGAVNRSWLTTLAAKATCSRAEDSTSPTSPSITHQSTSQGGNSALHARASGSLVMWRPELATRALAMRSPTA